MQERAEKISLFAVAAVLTVTDDRGALWMD
jgi:hypothetical protein